MSAPLTLRQEWGAFLRFLRSPRSARLPRTAMLQSARMTDWTGGWKLTRLLGWASTLWAVNVLALGPFVLAVFERSGATHRIDVSNLPWLQAILWAPIVEELLFRYCLRRPARSIWIVPLMVLVLFNGVVWWASALLACVVLLAVSQDRTARPPSARGYRWMRRYAAIFPALFHLVAVGFAAVHLRNFVFDDVAGWMMLVLVAPQWVTGLVLGWVRVTRGVSAGMLLHGVFNFGPLLVAWSAFQLVGDI